MSRVNTMGVIFTLQHIIKTIHHWQLGTGEVDRIEKRVKIYIIYWNGSININT